jgi:hypothetical protein
MDCFAQSLSTVPRHDVWKFAVIDEAIERTLADPKFGGGLINS